MVLVHRKHGDCRHDEQREARDNDGLRAEAIVEHAAECRADGAGDGEDDAEQAELRGAPAEHGAGVDAAKGKHGAKPVGVEHAREKEERDLAVMPDEFPHPADELGEPGPDRRSNLGLGRPVGREQKQRQDEDEIPQRRERPDQPIAFARRRVEGDDRIETEQRLAGRGIGDHEPGDEGEAHQAADIAHGPADARERAEPLGRDQRGHHGVVEHGGELGGDIGDGEGDEDERHEVGAARESRARVRRGRARAEPRTRRAMASSETRRRQRRRAPVPGAPRSAPRR